MTGWAILIALAALVGLGLIAAARPSRSHIMLIAAAASLAFAGYAWQGRPGLAGRPTRPPDATARPAPPFAAERRDLLETVGPDPQVLDAADQLIRAGDADYAAGILRAALNRRPGSMLLWLGFGNALVAQADGAVTPPARYAFDRAAIVAPDHPAPRYFLGLAYAASGDFAVADATWEDALRRKPVARWRDRLIVRLLQLRQITANRNPD